MSTVIAKLTQKWNDLKEKESFSQAVRNLHKLMCYFNTLNIGK